MEKAILIVCAAPDSAVNRKPWMPPGAVGELSAMINPKWTVRAWDEMVLGSVPASWIQNSSLVMLSGLTPSYYRMNEIASFCRENGIPLIAGGRDVIGCSREPDGLNLLADRFPSFCTTHMTKDLMKQILSDCANNGHLQQHYQVPYGTPYQFVIPDQNIITPSDYYARYGIRSSVGCLNNCPFCTVGGQGQFRKPIKMLEAELETFCHWFFLDVADSFAGILDHTEDILVVYKRSKMRWGTEITVSDLLGEDGQGKLISEMKQAGCMLIYLGIESIFRPIHGKVDRERTETVIRRCRKEGIITIGSLIFDITGKEMQEEIEETIHWATKWLDFAQFSLLALLPGCDLRIKALRDGNIIENDWRKFDGAHPTIKHPLSPEQRSQLLTRAYQEFSTFPNILRRALRAQEITAGVAVFCGGLRYRKGIPQF